MSIKINSVKVKVFSAPQTEGSAEDQQFQRIWGAIQNWTIAVGGEEPTKASAEHVKHIMQALKDA